MSVRVYMIKVMDDKIWLDGKRKIACGTSYLVIGAIINLKKYSNMQPKLILQWNHEWFSDVLEVCCFCTLPFSVFDSVGRMKNDVTNATRQAKTTQYRCTRCLFLFDAFLSE
jgi:hypothetical protein